MNHIDNFYREPLKKSADGRSFNVLGGGAIMPTEARQLMGLVRIARPELILEVGTGLGASAVAICSVLKELGTGKLLTLDPFQDHFGDLGVSEPKRLGLANSTGCRVMQSGRYRRTREAFRARSNSPQSLGDIRHAFRIPSGAEDNGRRWRCHC